MPKNHLIFNQGRTMPETMLDFLDDAQRRPFGVI